jgi:hypothetical protein
MNDRLEALQWPQSKAFPAGVDAGLVKEIL